MVGVTEVVHHLEGRWKRDRIATSGESKVMIGCTIIALPQSGIKGVAMLSY